ncbi:hypothetical protein AAFF_G00316500 [Aldrovandia affinis]|uniref:Uncharacterized protein n=1 Tax=Aldrovandia affinis TaxID=143900 RepID=A0AAD7SNF5_9TELE|nr:hypothetical protein AAFF_G00316500 [Aldrovandia affinis]
MLGGGGAAKAMLNANCRQDLCVSTWIIYTWILTRDAQATDRRVCLKHNGIGHGFRLRFPLQLLLALLSQNKDSQEDNKTSIIKLQPRLGH